LTAVTVSGAALTGADLTSFKNGEWLALYQRTHARQLKAAQRYLIGVKLATNQAQPVAPQLDQAYWEQGAATIFTADNLQTTFGKLAQDPALAEWFAQPDTATQVHEQAEQLLAELMGEEAHDEA